jgi:hypothetical protein
LGGQETRGGTFRIKAAFKRSPSIRATSWTLDGGEERFSLSLASVGGDEMREDRRELRQKILDHLTRDDDWQMPLALASAVGSTDEVVRRHVNVLFGESLITRQRGQLDGRGASMALCAEPLELMFCPAQGVRAFPLHPDPLRSGKSNGHIGSRTHGNVYWRRFY